MTALLYLALWLAGLYVAWALCKAVKRGGDEYPDDCSVCLLGCGSQACAERCERRGAR